MEQIASELLTCRLHDSCYHVFTSNQLTLLKTKTILAR